jgi:agmatine/peptidylarginine deiminase
MIADKDTNFVYFSELLRTKSEFAKTCAEIIEIFDNHDIQYEFLKGTKDIWARDYMPIQVDLDKRIEYRYDPDYLQAKKYRKIKSYPDIVSELNNISTQKTDVIIDGGNVIKSENSIIMTDKVIIENKENYSRDMIIGKLQELFETDKIALIPWDKENDEYGHADGMIRFVDNQTVLLQSYFDDYSEKFKNQLFGELDRIGVKWEKMEFDVNEEDERNWAYMNFLQTKDIILIPKFDIDEDIQAMKQIKRWYTDYNDKQIENVDMSAIVKEGGALNCISWTIRK